MVSTSTAPNLKYRHDRHSLPSHAQTTATCQASPRRYSKGGLACPGAVAAIAIFKRGPVVDQRAVTKHEAATAPSSAESSRRDPFAGPPTTAEPRGVLESWQDQPSRVGRVLARWERRRLPRGAVPGGQGRGAD